MRVRWGCLASSRMHARARSRCAQAMQRLSGGVASAEEHGAMMQALQLLPERPEVGIEFARLYRIHALSPKKSIAGDRSIARRAALAASRPSRRARAIASPTFRPAANSSMTGCGPSSDA